jgi:hypothetical protein
MLDDDDDDVDTVKVPILDESNPNKGSSLSVEPQPKGTSLATNVVEKVLTLDEKGHNHSRKKRHKRMMLEMRGRTKFR